MTTIVYDHKAKQIAVDSRTSSGTFINTDHADKSFKIGSSLLILAGPLADNEIFASEYPNIKTEVNSSGFCVEDCEVYSVSTKDGKLKKSKVTYSDSDGSGYAFALAALDLGKSAKEAVEYAMTRDNATGGKVKIYDVKLLKG